MPSPSERMRFPIKSKSSIFVGNHGTVSEPISVTSMPVWLLISEKHCCMLGSLKSPTKSMWKFMVFFWSEVCLGGLDWMEVMSILWADMHLRMCESWPGLSSTVMRQPARFSVSHNSRGSAPHEGESMPLIPPKALNRMGLNLTMRALVSSLYMNI